MKTYIGKMRTRGKHGEFYHNLNVATRKKKYRLYLFELRISRTQFCNCLYLVIVALINAQ